MGKEKNLKNTADIIIHKFISRNNDLDGYWALGIICLNIKNKEFELDLLQKKIVPYAIRFEPLIQNWLSELQKQLFYRNLKIDCLNEAKINVGYNFEKLTCTCSCTLVSKKGRKYFCKSKVYCLPHNPDRELRR